MKNLPVPLLQQQQRACGPTALSMVLRYFGKNFSPLAIAKKTGGIKKYGVRTVRLADVAKEAGFNVHCYSYNQQLAQGKATFKKPIIKDLIKFLDRKLPIIIAVRSCILFNKKPSKRGHFIVITKYATGQFWYNDPADGKQHKISQDDLLFAWYNNVLDSSAYLLVLEQK